MPRSISVILPTYNEKENILHLVKDIHAALHGYEHEVVVVDDNSNDGTRELIESEKLPYTRLFVRRSDRGLANSIRFGIERASGDVIVVMDSDYNHSPEYLPFMLNAIEYYDCVAASRFLYGGLMIPRSRHIFSWLFNIFVRFSTGGDITDNLYGFFAVRSDVLKKIDFSKVFWGYGDYCIRLFYYLQRQKATILQFPSVIGSRRGGQGNSKFLKVFLQYTKETLKLAIRGGKHV